MKSVVFSVLLSLAAPWGAACLPAGGEHVMACCVKGGETSPLVRPCCAMDAGGSAPTIPSATHAIAPLRPIRTVVSPFVAYLCASGAPAALASRPIEIRLLTSVFLI